MGYRRELISQGDPAPSFQLEGVDGAPVSLDTLWSQRPVALVFFKISCPVCQFALPFLDRIREQTGERSLRLVGISQDNARDTRDFHRSFGLGFPSLLDDERKGYPLSNACGISNVPTVVVVEPNGVVSAVWNGFSKADMEALGERAGAEVFAPGENVPAWKPG